jgi:hypothetical protein
MRRPLVPNSTKDGISIIFDDINTAWQMERPPPTTTITTNYHDPSSSSHHKQLLSSLSLSLFVSFVMLTMIEPAKQIHQGTSNSNNTFGIDRNINIASAWGLKSARETRNNHRERPTPTRPHEPTQLPEK